MLPPKSLRLADLAFELYKQNCKAYGEKPREFRKYFTQRKGGVFTVILVLVGKTVSFQFDKNENPIGF